MEHGTWNMEHGTWNMEQRTCISRTLTEDGNRRTFRELFFRFV
jgi:hypothetical protein